jgi:hypothetical protein
MQFNTQMVSNDILIRNRFLRQVSSDWESALTHAKRTLRKDLMPNEIIFPTQAELIFDNAHYGNNKRSKHSTNYMIRIQGKGFRRIYWGFEVVQLNYDAADNSFSRTVSGGKKCKGYKYIEIAGKIIVVIANFENP